MRRALAEYVGRGHQDHAAVLPLAARTARLRRRPVPHDVSRRGAEGARTASRSSRPDDGTPRRRGDRGRAADVLVGRSGSRTAERRGAAAPAGVGRRRRGRKGCAECSTRSRSTDGSGRWTSSRADGHFVVDRRRPRWTVDAVPRRHARRCRCWCPALAARLSHECDSGHGTSVDGPDARLRRPGRRCRSRSMAADAAAEKTTGRTPAPGRSGCWRRCRARSCGCWSKPGDTVRARQPLVVIEAMKMENELRAGRDGVVAELPVRKASRSTPARCLPSSAARPPP